MDSGARSVRAMKRSLQNKFQKDYAARSAAAMARREPCDECGEEKAPNAFRYGSGTCRACEHRMGKAA